MNIETLIGAGGILGAIFTIFFITLVIAAILMPIFVMFISYKATRISETLAAMEDMMRNGK